MIWKGDTIGCSPVRDGGSMGPGPGGFAGRQGAGDSHRNGQGGQDPKLAGRGCQGPGRESVPTCPRV